MHTQVAYLECSYQFINLQVTMAIHIGRKMEYIDIGKARQDQQYSTCVSNTPSNQFRINVE